MRWGRTSTRCHVAIEPQAAQRFERYTINADHRIIDGALAAQFLATLAGLLEHPLRILA
ncbi:pyruvate dehydrogenase E2 component (dihydrolipoamide acetyltransferase) [Sinosporangium album]|uniref:Pyruvate dehydrogenase E2 component (Dihydrolipoamide acetyltransferase) n=1 Tax=Sinosporangium album TaxID=504805 RepID=A0A1G7SBN6_9ACTN|nr:2-oxo acid dehydrogenase subunit E2 [Sinosporangium album]SDG20457.1 pyruvate dehydrogenase E2 component (dihydrolipoamide acetyltransferase) [Sinosporangium album]